MTVRLRVRRFRCGNDACPRRIFAERLPAIALPKARRTARLRDLQRDLGVFVGGEPGARLAQRFAVPVSPDTLLRLVRGMDREPPEAPRVIGVDDWAFRRGQRYGTIVVDLERKRTLDLLPDRQADTLAAWLRQHPSVEIVARDRAGAYADGIRQGAPDAIQGADRWHRLRNGSDALQTVFDRHHRQVRRALEAAAASEQPEPSAALSVEPERLRQAERRSRDRLHQRQARHEEIVRLRSQGMPMERIAQALGMSFSSVRRWVKAGQAPSWRKPPRLKSVDRHHDYLERRWQEGCRSGAQLLRELRGQGFRGGRTMVCQWANERRRRDPSAPHPAARPSPRVPTSRQAVRLVMAAPEQLTDEDRQLAERLVAATPEIGKAVELARAFDTMVKQRDRSALEPWLVAARASGLQSFADSLARDRAAVEAALTLEWSTGPVEGRITKLKLVKRQMYGRAKFDLLRQRVLAAA